MPLVQNQFRIVSNKKITSCFYRLSVDARPLVKKFLPGQFVNVRVSDGYEPLFRRPFSIHRGKKHIEIFYEAVGKGTAMLSQKKQGEFVDILGPLGNSFSMPAKEVKQIILIAGGVGLAPFLALTDFVKKKKVSMVLLYGGRDKEHVCPMNDFKKNGCQIHIATEDGSVGLRGRVDKLFSNIEPSKGETFIYTCGPKPMMKAVQDFALNNKIKGQASCESFMACGTGTCLGCVIKTTLGYKTVCYDGPVFNLEEIVF